MAIEIPEGARPSVGKEIPHPTVPDIIVHEQHRQVDHPRPEPKKRGRQVRFDDPEHRAMRERTAKSRAKRKEVLKKKDYLIQDRLRKKLVVHYKPHDKQIVFRRLIDEGKKIILFYGGIRSGKTFAGARELLRCIYKKGVRSGVSWIVSPTYPMSAIVEREFEKACDLGGGKSLILRKYVGSRKYLLVPPPGWDKPYIIEIKTAEHPDRLRGASLDNCWMDEAAMYDKEAYRILLGRILDVQGRLLMTTTPRGMNWIYQEVYAKAEKDTRIGLIKCVTSDNPHLEKDDIEHLRGQYSVQFAKQELGAEFVSFDGLVYPNFDFNRHIIQAPDKLPDGAEVIVGIDAGYKDPFVVLWVMRWNDRFYVIDEYYENMRTMESHGQNIKGFKWEKDVIRRWMDPSAAQEAADLERLHLNNIPAKNDIRAGINAVARLIELDRLYISRHCRQTLNELTQYQYKERDGKNTGEVPMDKYNHAMDALRYVIYSEDGYKKNHPFLTAEADGTLKIHGGENPDPRSNRLEDWIKMKGYNDFGEIEDVDEGY